MKNDTIAALIPDIKWSADGKWRRSLGVDLNSNIISNGGIKTSTYKIIMYDENGKETDKAASAVRFVHVGWTAANAYDTLYVQGQSGSTGYGGGKDMLMRKTSYKGSPLDESALSGVFWTRPTSPTVIGSYAECCFIKAEVLFKQGKKAEAFTAYKEGIRAHINYVNDVCKMWVAGDATLTDIPSFTPMKQADIDNYLNNAIGTAGVRIRTCKKTQSQP